MWRGVATPIPTHSAAYPYPHRHAPAAAQLQPVCTRHTDDSTLTAHLGGGSSAGRSRLCLPATAATLPPCLLAAGLPRQGVCPPLPSALCPSTTTQLHLELAAPCPGRPRSAAAAASWRSLSPCTEPTIFTFMFNRYSQTKFTAWDPPCCIATGPTLACTVRSMSTGGCPGGSGFCVACLRFSLSEVSNFSVALTATLIPPLPFPLLPCGGYLQWQCTCSGS